MLGSPAGPGGTSQRGLWPVAPAPAPTATSFSTDGLGKYGVYSLFPGGPSFGSALYSHASTIRGFTSGQFQQSSGNTFHAAHKVSDSLFSSSGYSAFGSPTPPPGSPYSPIPVAQLELLTKGFSTNSNSIIIQQPAGATAEFPLAVKKIQEKHCDEKCCSDLKAQKACNCQVAPLKGTKFFDSSNGCSRTNPIEWSNVNVKKEPGACQVAEISTSVSPIVKLEITSPTQKSDSGLLNSSLINTSGSNIPVGIAIARQRVQQEIIASPSLPPSGLLTTINGGPQIKELARVSEIDPSGTSGSMAATSTMGGQGGGAILQCTDDRSTGLAAWQMGGPHNQTLAAPTLWQYPAPVPVEPMVPLPVPMPPVGFQLVRDPTSGGLLLLPTTGIEPVQQAVVWPSYPQPSSVLLPSLPPMPPPPLQLLSSASSDYLSSSTTLHQHTQTHSTRLVAVTTDPKRKMPMPIPAATLIKIETDATLDQTKTLQAMNAIPSNSGAVFTDQNLTPLVTTHVIYQHPTNLILSQNQTNTCETPASCRSQATSPVPCLTPLPDVQAQEEETSTVQDASNQTDTPICSEDDTTTQTLSDVVEAKIKFEKEIQKPVQEVIIEEYKEFENNEEDRSDVTTTREIPKAVISVSEQDDCMEISMNEEPDLVEEGITEESKPTCNPDISGLELLSNSIVAFESCRNTNDFEEPITEVAISLTETREPAVSSTEEKMIVPSKSKVEDNLGGLDLLCALAEQRILEENVMSKFDKDKAKERKREKRKSKKHSSEEPRKKKLKTTKHRSEDREERKKRKYSNKNHDKDQDSRSCSCQSESYRTYKTPESEEGVKKFLASKSQRLCCKGEWPCMNAMELDMRMKLAELQREYREKQKELSKLKPKRHSLDCAKKRSRKKSTHSLNSDRSSTPPPLLDKMDDPLKPEKEVQDLAKPPSLVMPKLEKMYKLSLSDTEVALDKHSSSKKRKVGRPKKLMSSSGVRVATETIVAKKPKSSFVYNLLAAKEKLKLQNNAYPDATPPRYLEETFTIKTKKTKHNNNIPVYDEVKSSKIRPQLKAQPTLKTYQDEEHNEWDTVTEEEEELEEVDRSTSTIDDDDDMELEEETRDEIEIIENIQLHSKSMPLPEERKLETNKLEDGSEKDDESEDVVEETKLEDNRCILTAELLEVDKLRVLTAMGGLFYAGQLNALEPPDVYSITLDGERGNKPHIMSREEILRDAIVEVAPKGPDDLPMGTRICAYWSQQYRCLYPGSIAEPGTSDPYLDGKFVCVEFDDGDSGTIAIEDIRLLPPDYPIIEYDPNPLLSLSKRKRRVSTSVSTEDKSQKGPVIVSLPSTSSCPPPQPLEQDKVSEKTDEEPSTSEPSTSSDSHKARKRLKKKKRDKLKQDKKKKKKHKCDDVENCQHKKHHKKHRKHKKHEKNKAERIEAARLSQEEEEKKIPVQDDTDVENILEEESTITSDAQQYSIDTNDGDEDNNDGDEDNNDSVPEPEDEVTRDDILEATTSKKSKKIRDRQESCESRSKMSAFLPARQLWGWSGKGYKRQRAKGRSKKSFYKSIRRGTETITIGDSAVFLSTGRPDRPYIGKIEAMWELCGTMIVRVKWFYHPEETVGCPENLQYHGALFESPHVDENDVQTIAHKCEVLPLKEYIERLGDDPQKYAAVYDNNDTYYLAGYYDPTSHSMRMEPGIPFSKTN